MRASRQSAQFSINARMARRSAVSRGMNFPPSCSLVASFIPLQECTKRRAAATRPCHSREILMPRLAGKTAIVTGGAKGIGRHYSQALAAEGARVMIADIMDGAELAAEIAAKHGANLVASEICDGSDEAAVKRLVAGTMERFGKIDVLVNNAALSSALKPR